MRTFNAVANARAALAALDSSASQLPNPRLLRQPSLRRELLAAQADLKARLRAAGHRADSAMRLIEYCLQQPIFTVPQAQRHLGLTNPAVNSLVNRLVNQGVLARYDDAVYNRRFTAPDVLAIMLKAR